MFWVEVWLHREHDRHGRDCWSLQVVNGPWSKVGKRIWTQYKAVERNMDHSHQEELEGSCFSQRECD